jgi:hypothetical protein
MSHARTYYIHIISSLQVILHVKLRHPQNCLDNILIAMEAMQKIVD